MIAAAGSGIVKPLATLLRAGVWRGLERLREPLAIDPRQQVSLRRELRSPSERSQSHGSDEFAQDHNILDQNRLALAVRDAASETVQALYLVADLPA